MSAAPEAPAKPSFPPILVLTAAEVEALQPLGTAADRARAKTQACGELEAQWAARVGEVQRVFLSPSVEAYEVQEHALDARLAAEMERCPAWSGPLSLLRTMLREGRCLFTPTHAADDANEGPLPPSIGRGMDELHAEYAAMMLSAWQEASLRVGRSWDAWRAQATLDDVPARRQRYVFNLGTDDSLVAGVGGKGSGHFTALVRVATLPQVKGRLAALQGQGPASAEDVVSYVAASAVEAKAQGAGRVLFVNAAAPQVPSFAEGVARGASVLGQPMRYRDLADWQDGKLVSPQAAASFARELADDIEAAPGKTLLVVNCNAGLDRSGTTNALVQLILSARAARRTGQDEETVVRATMAQVKEVVAALKRGRPSSISSPGRYVFLYRAIAAALEAEAPKR